ncbi:MAG: prepilin-type N-terminal cleavage/methylation domain-containing protein [Methylotenera sp.]
MYANNKKNGYKQTGVTLVELVVFIVIVSVALVGVLKVLDITNRGSADPLVRKQALSIAESLILEIEQQPFTFCDPDDTDVSIATSAADCTNSQDKGGAALTSPTPNSESRYSSTDPFDNVADYGGFSMPGGSCAGICSAGDNTPLSGLVGYEATVTITRAGATAPYVGFALDAVLKISVRVTGPANTEVTLTGYRARYAPNI